MNKLTIHNPRLLHYQDDLLAIDLLGGVDLTQIERMVCTLRITHSKHPKHPMYRTTLDLYSDEQTDKLLRTLCDRWELKLPEVANTLAQLTLRLENYRLEQLQYKDRKNGPVLALSAEDRKQAVALLRSKRLLPQLIQKLHTVGIIGEDDNAAILFLALASHKLENPFSVLCLGKSGIGKSHLLQKLAECMPEGTYSFHTQISANALYYFHSHELQDKALFIEDLEWTSRMLTPLATLQSQGRLIKTRAARDKDGMLHSTTFEVHANLCLLACAYSERSYEHLGLPFLLLHLNHSRRQDVAVMDHQKRRKSGQIDPEAVARARHQLKGLIATLEKVRVVNPYAPLIELPEDLEHPRKSLWLLLNFIETVTYFFQYQRQETADPHTGERTIRTHPDDIALAFRLLKTPLFRRADELSTPARGFYQWLAAFLKEAGTDQFTALDIRKARAVHPRTLNRYLQELKLYSYVQVAGGNRHREGFRYKITALGGQTDIRQRIEQSLANTMQAIRAEHEKRNGTPQGQSPRPTPKTNDQTPVANAKSKPVSQTGVSDCPKPPGDASDRDRRPKISRTTPTIKN